MTSIKEALELAIKFIESHMHYSQPGPDRGEEPSDIFTHEALPVVVGLNAALATVQPDGERREAIADIIYPMTGRYNTKLRQIALEQVNRILASGLVQNEAGIRADEREKCAKMAEQFGEPYVLNTNTGAMMFRAQVSKIAASIRSARDGGEG